MCSGVLGAGVKVNLVKHEGKRISREKVSGEAIRCWPHLFSPRLMIIYLWSVADQPCMEQMRCGQTSLLCSHETFQSAADTPRL